MKKLLGRLFVASLLVSLSTSAIFAQDEGGRGNRGERGDRGGERGPGRPGGFGGLMRGGSVSSIVAIPDVAKEIKLDDAQKEQIQTARKAHDEEMAKLFGNREGGNQGGPGRGGPGGFSEENRKKFEELSLKLDKELADILDPTQFRRVLGIYAQADTVRSLTNPLVAEEIGVTEEQIANVKKIQEESGAKIREIMRGGADFRSDDVRSKMETARAEVSEKALAVLSAEQKQKLEELKGAKFDLPQGPGFGGRGQGGPGQGGPGRGGERRGPRN